MDHSPIAGVAFDLRRQPGFLLRGEPVRLARPVRQIKNADYSEQNRRGPLENEKPLPAGNAENSVEVQNGPGINEPKI
jgi:hypothetical protein